MAGASVEWSLHKDPDLMIEVWSIAALLEAVVAALLDDPANLKLALARLSKAKAP